MRTLGRFIGEGVVSVRSEHDIAADEPNLGAFVNPVVEVLERVAIVAGFIAVGSGYSLIFCVGVGSAEMVVLQGLRVESDCGGMGGVVVGRSRADLHEFGLKG